MTAELRALVDRAYILFKRYKAVKPLDACTFCCITEQQENALVSLSPKSIPADLLYDYNTAAKPAKLNLDEFRHFLPRYLELVAEKQFLSHDLELSFSRFDYFSKSDWSEEELELFSHYSRELFRYYLATYPLSGMERIDGTIIMLTKAYVEVIEILEQWKFHPSRASVLHLSDLLYAGELHNWKFVFDDLNVSSQILQWLQTTRFDSRFRGIMEDMIMNTGDLDEQQLRQLSITYSTLGF